MQRPIASPDGVSSQDGCASADPRLAAYGRLAAAVARAPLGGALPAGRSPVCHHGPDPAGCLCAEVQAWLATSAQLAAPDPGVVPMTARRRSAGATVPASILRVPLDGGGWLWAADWTLREWTPEEEGGLRDLAALLQRELASLAEEDDRRALETLVRTLGKAVENMQLGVTVTDLGGRIIYTNPAEARMHGYEVGELVGSHARILGPPEHCRARDPDQIVETSSWTRETVNVRKDGSRFPVLLWSDVVTDGDGRCLGVVTCSEDVTERKQAEQALRDFALRDPLTDLPNRTYFLERLTGAIQRAQREPALQFAVLFLDLDRFKVVNDSLGHHVGDELLGVIAARLVGCVRPTDLVARFGGDEFAVLLEGINGPEDAVGVAQRIQTEFALPIALNGYELFTSASIGIALNSPGLDQPEYLWRSADMAMYRAKAGGTGRFEIFDRAMHAEALARLQMETDLRRAVDRQEFRLHYQPVVSLDTSEVVGFEALLRWDHPLRGLVFPDQIIPLAEETGLILRIGEWVLQEGCRQLRSWQERFGADRPLWIGINLSSKQLSQPNLVEQVQEAVRAAGVPPGLVKLEITESAVVENTETAISTLARLKEFGVKLFMDDFGTGYSSLSYLHRLPLDALKIDRSFISQMVPGDKHAHLVETVLQLARSVGMQVVAEGISTPEQLLLLRELGCHLGQGYLFAKPLPAEQVEEYLSPSSERR